MKNTTFNNNSRNTLFKLSLGLMAIILVVLLPGSEFRANAQCSNGPPAKPIVSTNSCGAKTLTKGTPPPGVGWYWQGPWANGTDFTSASATSSTYLVPFTAVYYLGARDAANCWSYTSVKVYVDPVDITITSYDPVNTLVQATHSITLSASGGGLHIPAGSTFTARIAITPECNDVYNWTENIAYDENEQPLARTKMYLNNAGEEMQTQSIDYQSGKVWVSQPLYDSHGQSAASTLPAPILESDFVFKNSFVTSSETGGPYYFWDFDDPWATVYNPIPVGKEPGTLGWYYSTNNNLEPLTPVTSYPYTRTYTSPGPDPKTSTSTGPGDVHKMGSGHEAESERQLMSAGTELTHYLSLRPYFVTSSFSIKGYKYITTDPDEKKFVTFVDVDGRSLASATLTGTSTYDNWSYSYYNDLGQLVATVAPKGVVIGNTALPSFVTSYKYDHLGRLIETTSPDEGTTKFVYSTDGKIRFSENQTQRDGSPKRFSYTNYDYLGRLIESGEYSTGDYVFEPQTTSSPASNSILHQVDYIGQTQGITRRLAGQQGYISDYSYIEYDIAGSGFVTDANHPVQTNLQGQVSKTENENASTWYSYDEFSQLSWIKRSITGLDAKTNDYLYDYFGNVTQVIFQKGQFDDFYHHYTYDINQRLTQVHTSTDGVTKKLHATYEYYLHGPLKRVVLGNNLQGIDYTYTVNGALKAINHSDPAKDPGADGTDAFGETLHYFDGDYQNGANSMGTQTVSGYNNQYSGMLKNVSWHSPTDSHQKRTYAYTYDNLNQLSNAVFGSMTGSAGSYGFTAATAEAQREGVPLYDKNGNIQSLIRKGKTGNTLANYGYVYEPNTNKLDNVNHNGTLMADYTYNSIGQMTQQVEGSTTYKIKYNAYGLVKEVRNSSDQLMISYLYDDLGDLVKKTTYNGPNYVSTWYVRDPSGNILALYGQSSISGAPIAPHERYIYGAGRIGLYKSYNNTYFYEVNDHLGNVRAVIGAPSSTTVTATLETANQGIEQNQFLRYSNVRIVNAPIFDHTNGTGSQNSVRLSGSANEKTGLARSFSVSPGDVVKLEVYAKYVDNDRSNVSTALNSLVNAIAGGTAAAGTVVDGNAYAGNSSNPFAYSGLLTPTSASGPKAFLNYLFFDRNFVFDLSKSGFVPVTAAAKENGSDGPHEKLTAQLNITEPGYVYAYFSNDNPTPIEVYFDDFSVTHEQSAIVAGADYYPFGLPMENREITDEPYRYGYQGQFSEKDLTTGWNEFDWRKYDPKIGRFTTADPYGQYASGYVGMGNTPVNGVDQDGGYFSMFSWQGALVGAAVGAAVGIAVDKDNWGWYALGGAAAGGFLASDFSKVEIWGTHQGRGVYYSNNNGPGVSGREHIARVVKNPKITTTFDILVRHDPWDPGNSLWGKFDGHVFLIINGVDQSFRPTSTRKDGSKSIPPGSGNKNLILSDGWIGSAPGYVARTRSNEPAGRGYSHTEMRVRTTVDKKKALLDKINKAALNPPNYSFFIGKRCASFAMKMMRTSKVVPKNSIFHQFTPRALEKYMLKRPGTRLLTP